jgi:hypothetical protein
VGKEQLDHHRRVRQAQSRPLHLHRPRLVSHRRPPHRRLHALRHLRQPEPGHPRLLHARAGIHAPLVGIYNNSRNTAQHTLAFGTRWTWPAASPSRVRSNASPRRRKAAACSPGHPGGLPPAHHAGPCPEPVEDFVFRPPDHVTHAPDPTLALAAALLPAAAQAEIVIVTSQRSGAIELSREQAEKLYLGRATTLIDGTPVKLVDLPNGATRDDFYLKLTNKNPAQIVAYRSRLVFNGRATPPIEADNVEARQWLAETPNLIGYLERTDITSGMRVLLRLP